MRFVSRCCLLSVTILMTPVFAAAQPPALVVLSSNATREVLRALQPDLVRAAGREVEFRFANSAALKARIDQGERFDVAVLTRGLVDELVASGRVAAPTRSDIARAGVGVAIRKGAAAPDISSPDALKRTLLGAESIAYVGQGATAPIMRRIFDQFGIAADMEARTRLVLNAAEAVAAGDAQLGFTQISEILSIEGATLAGPLPAPLQVYTVFAAAVSSSSAASAAASRLIGELRSPDAAATMTAKGMEPVGSTDRLPPIPEDRMTESQRQAAAAFRAARGAAMSGPFHPLLRSPELMTRTRAMGDYLRFKSALPPRLSEFVILMTARDWTQQYEWNAHHRIALEAGLDPRIAEAVAEGRRPGPMADDEETLYDFCAELLRNRSVSDATYQRALARFGEQGVVDTIGIVGYYSMLAMVLNTARTPLPPGVPPPLAPLPR